MQLPKTRPTGRSVAQYKPAALRFIARVAIVASSLLVIQATVTVLWQEPLSAFLASRAQAELEATLEEAESTTPGTRSRRSDRETLATLAKRQRRTKDVGDPLGKITIPSLDVSFTMVEGAGSSSLKKGPGHYPHTQFPGEGGTFGVAGHRTTYLAPFRDVDELDRGDAIRVRMRYGRFVYAVTRTRIVEPTEVSVLDEAGRERIVLTACHPVYSAAQRIVVFARLERAPKRFEGTST